MTQPPQKNQDFLTKSLSKVIRSYFDLTPYNVVFLGKRLLPKTIFLSPEIAPFSKSPKNLQKKKNKAKNR